MNNITTAILLLNAIAILFLPRRWAPIPLLIGALYVVSGQRIMIGSFNFNVIRILIATGLVRVIIRGDRLEGQMNGLDKLMMVWTFWMLVSSCFYKDLSAAFINR